MFFGEGDLSFSDAALISARCLAISDWKVKMLEPATDPSEIGHKVADAIALRAASACKRFNLRRVISLLAVSKKWLSCL